MPIENDGVMIVLSSPSGAGKTTLVSLLSKLDNFEISVSHTTRKPRAKEIPDKDYYFVEENEFERLIKNQEFLEYAKVFNNFYGTTRTPVINNLNKGKNVLFDIDWQGAKKLRKKFNKNKIIDFFILPPSIKELKKRLIKRGRDNNKEIDLRLSLALSEMIHFKDYKYILINENINSTVNKLIKIIEYYLLIESNNIILNKKLKKLIDL